MSASVTFFGVRGSTPCSCDSLRRYGGNTSCVVIRAPGEEPLILDLGTGLRFFGAEQHPGGPFRASALVTHLHWDHVQGIPFFPPLLVEGSQLDLYAPHQLDGSLEEVVTGFLSPPYFPVGLGELPCEIRFHELSAESFELPGARVRSAWVPHVGPTLGYRIEVGDVAIAYISDHQQPGVGSFAVDDAVLEICDGADLLIHDAQYDEMEFALRSDWGHCSVDYAAQVAAAAGVDTLVLFHHDPSHTDERIDALVAHTSERASGLGVREVVAAHEGLTVHLAGRPRPSGRRADRSRLGVARRGVSGRRSRPGCTACGPPPWGGRARCR
ncbi:MAG: MBL fold metallo-hydrolase [Microthrixaceae bacterium]